LWSKKQMKDKKQNSGFNTPKNYFGDFEDRLFHKLNEDTIPKESSFTTPKEYFNQLDSSILQNSDSTVYPTKVIQLFSKRTLAYAITIAACATLIVSISNRNKTLNTIDNIEITSIESYIEEGNLEMDSYDIGSLLNDEDLTNTISEKEYITKDVIEDYLFDQIEDTSILIE